MMMINGDCTKELKRFNDNEFNLVLTSPPYNMNLRIRNGVYCSRQIVKEISTKYAAYSDNLPMTDYYEFNRGVISELLRVCKGPIFYNVQFLTGNKPALFKLIGEFSENIKEMIIWDKVASQPAMQEGVLNSQFEVLLVFCKNTAISRQFKEARFSRGNLSNLWQIKRGSKISKEHGATFPIELAEKVILNFSVVGDKVLDPFAGCGTTGAACVGEGREFTGIEISKKYCEIAEERIKNTTIKLI